MLIWSWPQGPSCTEKRSENLGKETEKSGGPFWPRSENLGKETEKSGVPFLPRCPIFVDSAFAGLSVKKGDAMAYQAANKM